MAAMLSTDLDKPLPKEAYDIMILGHTGQGKSTAADKLVVANPDNLLYDSKPDYSVAPNSQGLACEDISLWMADPSPSPLDIMGERLKSLVKARTTAEPQKWINAFREEQGTIRTRTSDCELLYNSGTNVRVLDVPGFYDAEARPDDTTNVELAIMRKLVRIQSNFGLNFRKVLYFLPVRGVMERAGAVVQTELRILIYYFGRAVLNNLVLVATNQKRLSLSPEGAEFSEEEREETMANFKKCLILVKLYKSESEIPQIPLICVSLSETCESILEKVKAAVITGPETIQLSFTVCQSCGVNSNDIESYLEKPTSKCHPKFIPDYRWYHKLLESLALVFTVGQVKSIFNPKEICVWCKEGPGSTACCNVGEVIVYNNSKIICQHRFSTAAKICETVV